MVICMQEVQMGEMVDRVARAIAMAEATIMLGGDKTKEAPDPRAIARAAIEAMREPTQDMIDACDINIPTEGEIVGVWDSMISAALK